MLTENSLVDSENQGHQLSSIKLSSLIIGKIKDFVQSRRHRVVFRSYSEDTVIEEWSLVRNFEGRWCKPSRKNCWRQVLSDTFAFCSLRFCLLVSCLVVTYAAAVTSLQPTQLSIFVPKRQNVIALLSKLTHLQTAIMKRKEFSSLT